VRASTRNRARIDVDRDAIALGTVSECERAIDARDATFVERGARARV
jgi:hypothetical protein